MPLDTRIALSGQPLQVQFRDPIASYNQLAQLTSADTQNQLAQMQMQEHQQMAPFRMQQAQTQAASAQLTYDQAKQAQDFITTVMAKAREHPEAPENVVEAAQQMMMHWSKQVQDVGAHLLDSYQKVATFKAQLAYAKESGGGAAPSAMAPAVAVGGINDANAPLVSSGAVQTAPAAAVAPAGIDQGKGVVAFPVRSSNQIIKEGFNDTIRITPDIRINGKFQQEILDKLKNYGETASLKEFPGMRWSLSPGGLLIREPIPEAAMDNKLALAAQGAPPNEVANGLVAKAIPSAQIVPNELQTANAAPALPANAGAKTAADLMAEIEAGDKKYAPFGVPIPNWKLKRDMLVKQLDEASKPPVMHVVDGNLVGPNGNVVFKSTPDMHFEKQTAADGTETILAVNKKTGEAKAITVNGAPAAGVNATIKAAQMRIEAEANKPAAKGSFEQVLDLANLDPDARQKMIMAKLAHDTAPPSAAADSQFERTMTLLGLSEAKKNALRSQLLAKEVRIPVEGGTAGKGKPPSGYRWDASGENLEIIPGGPADKQEKLKPIPANINTAISTNDMSIKRIQEALDLIKQYPDAVGLKNLLPGQALDRMDPKGVAARSAVSDIGSLVIHDRSGSAVSVGEMQRLGFIPTPTDRADNAKTKLEAMLKWAKLNQQGLSETYGEDQGYKASPTLSGKSKAAPATVSNW
jgi:hypothetical protein